MKEGKEIYFENGRRIVKGLGYYPPKKIDDLRELVKNSVKENGDMHAFRFKDKNGNIIGKSYAEFDKEIDYLGTALYSLGLQNKRIAIIGENRYEWGVCYFSVVNGTGVVVPLDKYLPLNEVENLINRGKVEAIFYSPAYQEMMDQISISNSQIKYFICMAELNKSTSLGPEFINVPKLINKGRNLLDSGVRSFVDASIDTEKMSVLLFTSGTTSLAKGVMLSHANIASNVTAMTTIINAYRGDVHLSLLPLHHTFENTIGLLYMVHKEVCITYCDGIKYITQNLKEYKVTLLVVVPVILEAMYKKINEGIDKSGKRKLLNILMKVSDLLRKCGIDIRRKLFKSIFEQFGPNLRLAVSGAAPLDIDVITGFDRIGLNVIQGYGLTETSPVIAANNDFLNVPGSVAYPMAGIEVALDSVDDNGMGEIITRGKNVMLGYFEDEAATKEVIDEEGWFKTGDLGTIDKKGILRITGRVKSMIVLTNGKKAFPEEYEVLLNNLKGVKDSFVWGNKATDGDIQICAKLVLDREFFKNEDEAEINKKINTEIKEINKILPQYKIIRYFVLSYEDIIKTTTLKIKRPLEYEKIQNILNSKGVEIRKLSGKFVDSQ